MLLPCFKVRALAAGGALLALGCTPQLPSSAPAPPKVSAAPLAAPGTVPAAPAASLASSPPPAPDAPAAPASEAPGAPTRAAPPPIPPSTSVLHIGDSFTLSGFAQALRPRMQALRARYEVRSEQSSYTTGWASKLEKLVADTQPDLVIITLGANEVANVHPEAHAPAVRHIARIIGERPCVWVTPPLWRKDTGMMEVIRTNSAPCRFFDTDRIVTTPIPRQSDGIHPTAEGGAIWADAFWAWLQAERAPALPQADAKTRQKPWGLLPAPAGEHDAGPGAAMSPGAAASR